MVNFLFQGDQAKPHMACISAQKSIMTAFLGARVLMSSRGSKLGAICRKSNLNVYLINDLEADRGCGRNAGSYAPDRGEIHALKPLEQYRGISLSWLQAHPRRQGPQLLELHAPRVQSSGRKKPWRSTPQLASLPSLVRRGRFSVSTSSGGESSALIADDGITRRCS
jgi:hypothetical protein